MATPAPYSHDKFGIIKNNTNGTIEAMARSNMSVPVFLILISLPLLYDMKIAEIGYIIENFNVIFAISTLFADRFNILIKILIYRIRQYK